MYFLRRVLKFTTAVAVTLTCFTSLLQQDAVEAHVTANPKTRDLSTATAVTNFVVPHPCSVTVNNSTVHYSTIGLSVQFPTSISSPRPQEVAGWNLTIISTTVNSATQLTFNWTKQEGNLMDASVGLFPVYWSVPSTTTAATFVFPTIQICEGGQFSLWTTDPSITTSSSESGALPAPSVKFTPVTPLTSASSIAASQVTNLPTTSSSDWTRSDTLSVVAIVLSVVLVLTHILHNLMKWLKSDAPAADAVNADTEKKMVI